MLKQSRGKKMVKNKFVDFETFRNVLKAFVCRHCHWIHSITIEWQNEKLRSEFIRNGMLNSYNRNAQNATKLNQDQFILDAFALPDEEPSPFFFLNSAFIFIFFFFWRSFLWLDPSIHVWIV